MDEAELYRLKSLLDRSTIRRDVLELLTKKGEGIRPSDIASELGKSRPTVSKRLLDLKKEGLVKVLNPDDNRNRYYTVTEKGETLIERYGSERE